VKGFQGGYSSAVIVADVYYQVDNGAQLYAYDATNGKELWKQNLGTVQKASLVYGDGKLYVGTESGKFWILKPSREKCEVVSEVALAARRQVLPDEQVLGSVAISGGRVFAVSTDAIYAIGKAGSKDTTKMITVPPPAPGTGEPSYMIVTPTEVVLKPGESVQLHAKLFDAGGGFLREEKATWTLNPPQKTLPNSAPILSQLPGAVADGKYTVPSDAKLSAGEIQAKVGALTANSRLRVIPPMPYSEDFDSLALGQVGVPAAWINALGKYEIREVNGSKSLVKLRIELPFRERARTFFGLAQLHDRSRRQFARQAPPNGRRRTDRAELHDDPDWKRPARGTGIVELRRRAHREGRFPMEGRHLVPHEAGSAEHARRQGSRARQSVASRRGRTGSLAGAAH
jgi:hypothetical protein